MKILYLLIPISVLMVIAAIFAFRWAVKNRQFDDMSSPGMIPLMDDSDEERAQRRGKNKVASNEQEIEIDPALIEIFWDETDELLDLLQSIVQTDQNQLSVEEQNELVRVYHTLLGAARLVGFPQIAALAWEGERRSNMMHSSDSGSVQQEHFVILSWLQKLREVGGNFPEVQWQECLEKIAQLRLDQ